MNIDFLTFPGFDKRDHEDFETANRFINQLKGLFGDDKVQGRLSGYGGGVSITVTLVKKNIQKFPVFLKIVEEDKRITNVSLSWLELSKLSKYLVNKGNTSLEDFKP